MNGEKPLNIPADPLYKPDIEVKTKEENEVKENTPEQKPLETPNTPLQEALTSTIDTVVPPAQIEKSPIQPIQPEKQSVQAEEKSDKKNIFGNFKNFLQKPIRTYESDVADLMSQRKTSTASMVIAENKKEEKERTEEKNPEKVSEKGNKHIAWKKMALGFGSAVIIVLGIYGGYYLYSQSALSLPPPIEQPIVVRGIVPADVEEIFMINNTANELLAGEINSKLSSETESGVVVRELILGEKIGENSARITASSFIDKVELAMPESLKRSITDRWMMGSFSENGGKTPFLIFKTDFFQNAFSGMLSWESSMAEDIAKLMGYEERARAEEEAFSGSIASYFTIRGTFVDKQIKNRDVREFVSRSNTVLFLYSFIDKNTIILTTTESALLGLLERLEKETYVR